MATAAVTEHAPTTSTPAQPSLPRRMTIRNHVSGPGGADESPAASGVGSGSGGRAGKESLLGFGAGLIAGVVGVITGYPFDTLKTRKQVYGKDARLLEGGLKQHPVAILRQLFRGIGPPLVTTGLVQTLNFGCYDLTLRFLREQRQQQQQQQHDAAGSAGSLPARPAENVVLSDYFVAGAAGGIIISAITCPASLVKIQMQTSPTGSSVSYWTILAGMRQRGLVAGFYRAYIPDVINQSFGRGTYMCTYEGLKRLMREDAAPEAAPDAAFSSSSSSSIQRPQPLYQRIIAAGLAGIAGWIVIFPCDVVKSRMQADALAPGKNKYANMSDCFRQTWAQGGLRSLYSGLGFTLLRAVPVASVILPTYDWAFFMLAKYIGEDDASKRLPS